MSATVPAVSSPKETPAVGAKPDDLLAFLNARITYQSVARMGFASTWTKATKYRAGHQWLQPSYNLDPTRTPHWSDIEFAPDDDDYVPQPVQNEMFVHLSNEAARLGKPEFEPYVRPDGENPDATIRTGARLAERALQDRLIDMDWDEIEAEGDMHMPLLGQSIYKSWWETDATQTTRIPVTTAKCCPRNPMAMGKQKQPPVAQENPDAAPQRGSIASEGTDDTNLGARSVAEAAAETPAEPTPESMGEAGAPAMEPQPEPECGFVTSTPEVTPDHASTVPPEVLAGKSMPHRDPQMAKMGMTELGFEVASCPTCQDHPPLVDYYPSEKEAAKSKDYFGRPLGEDKPLGQWRLSVVSPHDLFIQSMGVGIKFKDAEWWCETYPAPVAWIAKHFENGKFVKPESAQAIMEWHPVGGERAVFASGGVGDSGVFQDFSRVKEYHERPSLKFPLGRSIVMSGSQVLLDSTFRVPSQTVPGEHFDRVHIELIPWEPRPHEAWGLSMAELLFSLQEDLNEVRSMEQDLRQRMGVMFWLAQRGMNLDTVALSGAGYNGKVVEYESDPLNPGSKPSTAGGEKMPEMVPLAEFFIDAMGRIAGTADPEAGTPPAGGEWSAVALQYLAEKSGERRGIRLRRKRKALERLYKHGLELMYHRCLEPRTLRFKDADGKFKERAWRGIEFEGQIGVTIDAESEHDTTLQKQQKILDLIGKNFYDIQNPAVRDKIAEKLEAPRDIDGQMETQRSAANREWCDFRDTGKEPIVHDSIDDAMVHHDQHGLDIQSETFRDLEDEAQWDAVYPFISDWWQQFPMLEQQLAAAQVQRSPLLEHRIVAAWDALLVQRGIQTSQFPPEQLTALRKVMRFTAHFESHKKGAELAAQAAQAGAAVLAAPGGEETQQGTVPTAGNPAAPQPGTMSPPAVAA